MFDLDAGRELTNQRVPKPMARTNTTIIDFFGTTRCRYQECSWGMIHILSIGSCWGVSQTSMYLTSSSLSTQGKCQFFKLTFPLSLSSFMKHPYSPEAKLDRIERRREHIRTVSIYGEVWDIFIADYFYCKVWDMFFIIGDTFYFKVWDMFFYYWRLLLL